MLQSILRRVDRPPSIGRKLTEKTSVWVIFLINYYCNKQGYELKWDESTDNLFLRKLSAEEERAMRHTPSMDKRSDIQFEYHVYNQAGGKSNQAAGSRDNWNEERKERGFGKQKEWGKKKKTAKTDPNAISMKKARKLQRSSSLGTKESIELSSVKVQEKKPSQSKRSSSKRRHGQRRANKERKKKSSHK